MATSDTKPVDFRDEERVCKICGATFHPKVCNQVCCGIECSEVNRRNMSKYDKKHNEERKAWEKEHNKTWKKDLPPVKKDVKPEYIPYEKRVGVCDKFCDGCAFKGTLQFDLRVCNYLLCTGKRRPCPAGTGCTVKETGRRRMGWHEEEVNSRKNHRIRKSAKEQREHKREYDREHREKNRKDREFTMQCGVCGKLFKTTDTRRRNCSPECSTRARTRSTTNYRKRRKANEQQVS